MTLFSQRSGSLDGCAAPRQRSPPVMSTHLVNFSVLGQVRVNKSSTCRAKIPKQTGHSRLVKYSPLAIKNNDIRYFI